MLTKFRLVSTSFLYATTSPYAQTQPRTVAGGLRPHLSKTGLRPEPGLEQLESAEQIDLFDEIYCGFYLEGYAPGAYLFVCFMMICRFSARLNFLVPPLQANHINRFHVFGTIFEKVNLICFRF